MESKSALPDPVRSGGPRELPFDHVDLDALGGHIGPEPEDFVVDEQPLYVASGQGDHWYVRLRKREATTLDLRAAVAEAAGVAAGDVGYAGMKDKHAVTTQWLSVPVVRARPPEAWQLPAPFSLLEVSRHNNKLRVGHLEGNHFTIRLVDVGAGAPEQLDRFFERVAAQGLTNYFGAQRFGSGQQNLDGALFALRRGRLGPRAGTRGKFLASVIQSEVFNRYAIERVALGAGRLLAGDVVRFRDGRAMFSVEDAEREQPRLDRGELRLTGPMVGPKMKASAGEPLRLEQAALDGLGLDEPALRALGRWAPGTRRDLLLWPSGLAHEPAAGGVTVRFALPAGAYASLVIRALTRQDPWLGAPASDAGPNGDEGEGEA
ncbi:MAG TPA: tRNA pseudouridine(13) synthase TruD [Polyangiaceae bacterium]|nr:tRNA pseudouridine(13) synthase TruD [Polyangiaceae bacterium]